MLTIRLRINENIAKHVLFFLNKFDKEEVEIIAESEDFFKAQNLLNKELSYIESKNAEFYTVEEVEIELEKNIKKHEA
jgi:hypothetical protein